MANKPPLAPFAGCRDLTKFMSARERHRVSKQAGSTVDRPDKIISMYRFCNVRRNDDRVTKWIHGTYLDRWRFDPDLWFALLVARLFNNEDTLADIEQFVIPYDREGMRKRLKARAAKGLKNFNAAYIVSTAGARMDKIDYVMDYVLRPAWKLRMSIGRVVADATLLDDAHKALMSLNGVASFMAGQVIGDLKYASPDKWEDFQTFVCSGPGSKRGLNRVYGLDKDLPMSEDLFRERLAAVSVTVHKVLKTWKPITAQDLQNCLCEFDKYERARTGEGKPKQLYKPQED